MIKLFQRLPLFLTALIAALFTFLIPCQAASNNPNLTTTIATPADTTKPATPPSPQNMTGLAPITPSSNSQTPLTPPPDLDTKGYVLMDANSGQILAAKNPDTRMEPASLTKIMSMYVISEALKSGKIHLNDLVTISKDAWRTGGSRMFIQVGTQVPVQQLIDGIVVVSGNDAAVAMAEYVGGTEDTFVSMMNQSAAQLGMKNSHFEDVNGLPEPGHYSSPHDLAILARALINNFPDYYKAWYSQKFFEYNKIKQPNRNRLLWQDPSVDGIKTGHTAAAGYCLVSSAQRNGMRLISVVMGATSSTARVNDSKALLNWGFRNYSSHQLFAAGQPLAKPRVWFGAARYVPVGIPNGLFVTIPNNQYQNLKATLTLNDYLEAPVTKGQQYGSVEVTLNNQLLFKAPVVALQDDPVGGIVNRSMDHLAKLFHRDD